MSEYDEAMHELSAAGHKAAKLAQSEEGAPEYELRELAAEIDCLLDHNCSRKDMADAKALYEGARQAGLVPGDVQFVSVRGTVK